MTHVWQGWQESNPQPSLLESAALPIELHPYACAMMIAAREGFVKAKMFGIPAFRVS
jgi:hypothetical protein